ncbi:MAG: transcription elongation factor GreA [Phycisphaerales bacterium]|nr:transcription elongation factor GreA [Phycisphaerales bacterium]
MAGNTWNLPSCHISVECGDVAAFHQSKQIKKTLAKSWLSLYSYLSGHIVRSAKGATMEMISQTDKERLEAQLSDCLKFRPVIAGRIAEARAQGDLKENADYHAAREDQAMNEAKVRDLEAKLSRVQVAGEIDVPLDMVFLGAIVVLRDVKTNREEKFRLVGQLTEDSSDDYIEVTGSSPIGMALMKARIGETVRVDLPKGERRFLIVKIEG